MKRKYVFIGAVMLFLFGFKSLAQSEGYAFIPSKALTITYNKTTNLIFPLRVQNIDRGSKDILVQQPEGTENIVQVKADKLNFAQTNLSVITVDGSLYSFTVDYAPQPAQLNIIIATAYAASFHSAARQTVLLTSGKNEVLFDAVARKIIETKTRHVKTHQKNQVKLQLNGIYINRDVLYFRLQLKNNSNISYDVSHINFTIKDRQKTKRTATQEMKLTPIYKFGALENLSADSSLSTIIALPKFTLPNSKYLSIQILEKDGGRNFLLRVRNNKIVKAIPVPDLK